MLPERGRQMVKRSKPDQRYIEPEMICYIKESRALCLCPVFGAVTRSESLRGARTYVDQMNREASRILTCAILSQQPQCRDSGGMRGAREELHRCASGTKVEAQAGRGMVACMGTAEGSTIGQVVADARAAMWSVLASASASASASTRPRCIKSGQAPGFPISPQSPGNAIRQRLLRSRSQALSLYLSLHCKPRERIPPVQKARHSAWTAASACFLPHPSHKHLRARPQPPVPPQRRHQARAKTLLRRFLRIKGHHSTKSLDKLHAIQYPSRNIPSNQCCCDCHLAFITQSPSLTC